MPKYLVSLTRQFTQHMERVVEASGPDEAEDKALQEAVWDGVLFEHSGEPIAVAPPLPIDEPPVEEA